MPINIFFNNYQIKIKQEKIKNVFNNKSLNEAEFNNVTNKCKLPKYLNGALFRKVLKFVKNKKEKEAFQNYNSDDNTSVEEDENISSNIQRSSKKLNNINKRDTTQKQIPLKLIQLEKKLKELKQFNLENCETSIDSVVSFEDFIE